MPMTTGRKLTCFHNTKVAKMSPAFSKDIKNKLVFSRISLPNYRHIGKHRILRVIKTGYFYVNSC